MRTGLQGRNGVRAGLALAALAAILSGSGCAGPRISGFGAVRAAAAGPAGLTRVFLVRHAEKASGVPNPPLTEEGRARARALAHAVADAGIEVIYSTEFARTRETAQAVADVTGLEVRIFPVGESGIDAFIQGQAAEITELHAGRTVLVVGHSNTVPALMRALGATEAADLTERDYDDLFLVGLEADGTVQMLQLHYGAASQ